MSNVLNLPDSGHIPVYKKVTYTVNSNLKYTGESKVTDGATDRPIWRISRYIKQGLLETVEYADGGEFSAVWDLRESYFTSPALLNTLSTSFDGIDDFVSFGNAFLYDRSTQFSMAFWIKPNNLATQQCIYSKVTPDTNVYGFSIQINTSGRVMLQARASGSLILWTDTSLSVTAGVWNYVVVTYAGGSNLDGFRVYINGTQAAAPGSTALSGSWLSGQQSLLGSRNGIFYYSGYMDEVSIWSKSLTQAEVVEAYNGGSPTDLSNHTASGNLVNYYRMGDLDAFPVIADSQGLYNGTCINMISANFVSNVP